MNKRIKKKRETAITTPLKSVSLNRAKTLIKWANAECKRKESYDFPLGFIIEDIHRYYTVLRRSIYPRRYNLETMDIFPVNDPFRSFRSRVSLNTSEIINRAKGCRYVVVTNLESLDDDPSESFMIIDTIKRMRYDISVGISANSAIITTLLPYINFARRIAKSNEDSGPQVIYCEELNDTTIDTTDYNTMTDSLDEIGNILWTYGARFPALKQLKQQFFAAYHRD